MTNTIRGMVSKQRKRYQEDGFNLDLAYIQPNLIAMGFPAEKLEGVYRNHIDDVFKFLESKHNGVYKIYNLCSERRYDSSKFHSRVENYPFDDHNPPKIELIKSFCDDVHHWLISDSSHVAAVHCKAGKGRTGTMICCFMLHDNLFQTANDALNSYDEKRTHDNKGVTIPSQRRYVDYYARLLRSGKKYTSVSIQICEIILSPPPILNSYQGSVHFSISNMEGAKIYNANVPDFKKSHGNNLDGCISIRLDQCIPLVGDVKVEFYCKNVVRKKDKLFHFWFNTYFANELAEEIHSPQCEQPTMIYKFKKHELDHAHKDKQDKIYPPDFEVQLLLQKIPSGTYSRADNHINAKSTYDDHTPSESSEASSSESTEEEGIWESETKRLEELALSRMSSDDDVGVMPVMSVSRRMSHMPLSNGLVSLLSKRYNNRPRREST